MKKTNLIFYGLSLMLSASLLTGCGSDDEKYQENDMQEESSEPNMTSQQEARGTDPTTSGKQAGEGNVKVEPEIGGYEALPSQTITRNAQSNTDLSTFLSLVKTAGLVNTLNGTGPYTVFAPSNKAFEALPEGALDDLMDPANKQQLVTLINNHVVAGKLDAGALQDGSSVKTLGNGQVQVSKRQNQVTINGAKVTSPDIVSSNGVIHVVDKVLMPETR